MRQSSGSGRRMRGRPNRNKGQGGVPNRNSNFESNGPEGRVRGNASQVYEKYLALGREAVSSGDRVMGEAFYQHAEHYYRLMNETTDPLPAGAQPRPQSDENRGESGSHDARPREETRRDEPRRDDRRRDAHRRPRPNGAGSEGGFRGQPRSNPQPDLLAGTSAPAAQEVKPSQAKPVQTGEPQEVPITTFNADDTATPPASADRELQSSAMTSSQGVESESATVEQPTVNEDAPPRPRRGRPRKRPVEAAPEQEANTASEAPASPCEPQAVDG